MRNIISLLIIALNVLTSAAFAGEVSQYYLAGALSSPLTKLKPTNDTVGAPGYVSSCCSTGKMGEVNTASDLPTWDLKLGYIHTKELRFDISYIQTQFGTTTWGTDFGSSGNWPIYRSANATKFSGGISSKTILISSYYSFLNSGLPHNLTPFIGVGVGPSWNKFNDADEGGYNRLWGQTKISFAYKFDFGLDYAYDKNITFDLGARLINLGSYSSANSRGTNHEVISPYKLRAGLLPSITMGIRYSY